MGDVEIKAFLSKYQYRKEELPRAFKGLTVYKLTCFNNFVYRYRHMRVAKTSYTLLYVNCILYDFKPIAFNLKNQFHTSLHNDITRS